MLAPGCSRIAVSKASCTGEHDCAEEARPASAPSDHRRGLARNACVRAHDENKFSCFLWRDCDPEIAETALEAVSALAGSGARTLDFTLPEAHAAYAVFLEGGLSAIELRSFLDAQLPEWPAQLDPVIAPAVRNAETLSARDYLARVEWLRTLAQSAEPRLAAVDVIASPTLCLTPPLMSEVAEADSHLRVNRRIVRNTAWVNYLGLCADHDAGRALKSSDCKHIRWPLQ